MALADRLDKLTQEYHRRNPTLAAERNKDASSSIPLYLVDLQERADRLGQSAEALRTRDQELLANSQFPSPDCLKADEVLAAVIDQLPDERREHCDSCLYCQVLVGECRTDEKTVMTIREEFCKLLAEQQPSVGQQSKKLAGVR